MDEQGYKLIIAYFEKTITDNGLTQLQEWIEQSPENLAQFSDTIQILEASRSYFNRPDGEQQHWDKIQQHITGNPEPVKKLFGIRIQWLAAAATLLIVGLFGIFWIKQRPQYIKVVNANGQRSKVQLPDGSVVYLAGGSSIRYIKDLEGKERNIILNGEAFFDVVHMTSKPFAVKSGSITTVVLGTSFNIKAYGNDHDVAVTVHSGKVGVMASVNGDTHLIKHLTANQQIDIDTRTGLYNTSTLKAGQLSSWLNNEFDFYETSMREISATLQRHYGVQIQFTRAQLGNIKLTAKFSNSPLPEVLETLSTLSGLAYTQTGNRIYFSNNDQKGGSIMR